MIITLMGADFSASNIGTLSTWRITRSLGAGATYEGPTSVDKGAALNATINIINGYELGAAGITITMNGTVLNGVVSQPEPAENSGVNYHITIAEVTGNILIKVPTVNTAGGDEPDIPDEPNDPTAPIVNLTLANVTDGVLRNTGTGGSTYNATIFTPKTGDSYSSNANGLTLAKHAYADVPYGFKASDKFTIVVRGSLTLNTNQYQRLMRTDIDAPSIFYSYTSGMGTGAKLSGVVGSTIVDEKATNIGDTGSSLNTVYIKPDNLDTTTLHKYAFVSDGSTISYYVDDVLIATQSSNELKTSTKIGIGDNDSTKTYYAAETHVDMFHIYNYAMTAEQLAKVQ